MSFWPSSAAFLFVRAGHRMYRSHAPETGRFLNGSSASDGFRFIPKATCLGDGGTMSCVAPNTVATTRSWRYSFLQTQCRSCGNSRTMTPTGTGRLGRKTWLTGSTRKTTRTSTWALAVFLGASQCDNAKTIRNTRVTWKRTFRCDRRVSISIPVQTINRTPKWIDLYNRGKGSSICYSNLIDLDRDLSLFLPTPQFCSQFFFHVDWSGGIPNYDLQWKITSHDL